MQEQYIISFLDDVKDSSIEMTMKEIEDHHGNSRFLKNSKILFANMPRDLYGIYNSFPILNLLYFLFESSSQVSGYG